MVRQLKVTAITENTAGCFDALGEWGLSLWIEANGHRLLSDTGRGQTLRHNAHLLGIDLASANALVVSHGHHDHTGGIAELIAHGFRGKIYAHPDAWQAKFQKLDRPPHKSIGIPAASLHALEAHKLEVIPTVGPTEIAPGILVTGAIPRRHSFETITDPFYRDEACTQPDTLDDDQAVMIEMPAGWVVITGCGHSGIVNTLSYAAELSGGGHLYAILGGMHLFRALEERIQRTISELEKCGIKIAAACHCSGAAVTIALQPHSGLKTMVLNACQTIQLPEARQFTIQQ